MITRRQGLLMLLVSQSATKAAPKKTIPETTEQMDVGMPESATLPDTLAVAIARDTKHFQVQADGRVVTFSVKDMMDALGAKHK
jgi:hypothetical protein